MQNALNRNSNNNNNSKRKQALFGQNALNNKNNNNINNNNNNLATRQVAAAVIGKTYEPAAGATNRDNGENYLKTVEFNRNILRDGGAGGGGGGSVGGSSSSSNVGLGVATAAELVTTEKYPTQWGYQVLPSLYSVYQKVANDRRIGCQMKAPTPMCLQYIFIYIYF